MITRELQGLLMERLEDIIGRLVNLVGSFADGFMALYQRREDLICRISELCRSL